MPNPAARADSRAPLVACPQVDDLVRTVRYCMSSRHQPDKVGAGVARLAQSTFGGVSNVPLLELSRSGRPLLGDEDLSASTYAVDADITPFPSLLFPSPDDPQLGMVHRDGKKCEPSLCIAHDPPPLRAPP